MTVNVIDGQLKVTLTETETVKYNIDRVFFDKASLDAAKALSYLLKAAASQVSFSTAATRFAIELYPVFEGGCEVWYIPDSPHAALRCTAKVSRRRWSVFEFDSSDGMLSACEAVYSDEKCRYCASGLYETGGKYRLVVSNLGPALHRRIVCNFADRVLTSSVDRAKTLEHWHCICPKNAVAMIGAAMCKETP